MELTLLVTINNSTSFITNLLESLKKISCNQLLLLNGILDNKAIKLFNDYKKYRNNVEIINSEKLLRHCAAINILIDRVKTKYIFIMDSDIITTEEDILSIHTFLTNNKTYGAVQGLLIYPQTNLVQSTGHIFHEYWNYYGYHNSFLFNLDKPLPRQALSAGFTIYPTHIVKQINGFDEFYQHRMDGIEFSTRIAQLGYKMCCLPTASGFHYHSLFSKSINNKPYNEISKYWATYGSYIKDDLILELKNNPLYRVFSDFCVIDCSTIKDMDFFFNEIGINNKQYILKVTDTIDDSIILDNEIPYSILNSNYKILWICTNYTQISNNFIILSNRKRQNDYIIDMNANIIPVKTLNYTRHINPIKMRPCGL